MRDRPVLRGTGDGGEALGRRTKHEFSGGDHRERQSRSRSLDVLDPDLPDVPTGNMDPTADAREWLFDSRRGYDEQTEILLRRNPKKTP